MDQSEAVYVCTKVGRISPQFYPTTRYLFFFNDKATTEIYTLSLHDALPISRRARLRDGRRARSRELHRAVVELAVRSEEHTSELQSPDHLVCRLLLEKK